MSLASYRAAPPRDKLVSAAQGVALRRTLMCGRLVILLLVSAASRGLLVIFRNRPLKAIIREYFQAHRLF
jgi:hypothetical protein